MDSCFDCVSDPEADCLFDIVVIEVEKLQAGRYAFLLDDALAMAVLLIRR